MCKQLFFFEPKRELSRLHSERKIRKLIEEKTMEPLREKMMNQKSMADVQKYMHQFNKGTRKDKDGRVQAIIKMILFLKN